MNVVNILGINDENKISVQYNQGSLKDISLKFEGNSTILQKLKNEAFNITILLIGGKKSKIKYTLPKNAVLFNSIGIAEGNQKSLRLITEMMVHISNPIINHPRSVLRTLRDQTTELLSDIKGVIIPKCLKLKPVSIQEVEDFIAKKSIPLPFLFRPVVEHGAQTLIKINTPHEMQKLHRFAFDGSNEFYVTSFLDFSSSDKLYRKMRFLIIGDEIIPRHIILSKTWQIHTQGDDILQKQQIEEEIVFLRQIDLSVGTRLLAIKKALELDYFGIDCAIGKRGNIIVFEANPFSMIGLEKTEKYHQETIKQSYDSLTRLIHKKASTFTS